MSDTRTMPEKGSTRTARGACSVRLPAAFIELVELRSISVEHKLGYFGIEPYVLFGYCPGGAEVIWRDGHSSGFGFGGWRSFLWEIAPLAARHGADLGDAETVGRHVLLTDRANRMIYAAPREQAEAFLSRTYGVPPPARPCLCSRIECALCTVLGCPHADITRRSAPTQPASGESSQTRIHGAKRLIRPMTSLVNGSKEPVIPVVARRERNP